MRNPDTEQTCDRVGTCFPSVLNKHRRYRSKVAGSHRSGSTEKTPCESEYCITEGHTGERGGQSYRHLAVAQYCDPGSHQQHVPGGMIVAPTLVPKLPG